MTQITESREEYKKVVDSGESMTQIRGNAAAWYKGDNTEYVEPSGIAPYERESYSGEKKEIINNGEEIKFSVEIEGRMSRIIAEFNGEKVETRWTTKAVLNWWYHDHERLHDEQYKLAQQLAGKEYGIVGTGNKLWLKPAPEQEWVRWQRKQPEEAILTISFGKITGNNGIIGYIGNTGDRLIRGHAKVHDIEGNELIHVTEIYATMTPGLEYERRHLLILAKAEMEKKLKCDLCERGQVFFKNLKNMKEEQFAQVSGRYEPIITKQFTNEYGVQFFEDWKKVYLVTWYPVELNEVGQCAKCFAPEKVWRNSTVETDIPTDEHVMLRDQLDYESKDEETTLDRMIHMEDRLTAYDDIEFIASLDRHAVNEHLGTGSNDCKNESFLWAAANTTREELEEAANNV